MFHGRDRVRSVHSGKLAFQLIEQCTPLIQSIRSHFWQMIRREREGLTDWHHRIVVLLLGLPLEFGRAKREQWNILFPKESAVFPRRRHPF